MTDQEKHALLQHNDKKFNDAYYQHLCSVRVERRGFLLSEDILKELSTDKVNVVAAGMTNQHDAMWGYGKLKTPASAEYEGVSVQVPYIQFYFEPYAGQGLSNIVSYVRLSYPTEVKKCLLPEDTSDFYMSAQIFLDNKSWTSDAFLTHIPTKSLSEEGVAARKFIRQIQKVSREHKWADKAKKIQKEAEETISFGHY